MSGLGFVSGGTPVGRALPAVAQSGDAAVRGAHPMGVGLRKVRGFTLIELLVVIVIIGIVVGFATLSLGGDRRGDELEEESRRFAALLSLA
ncbi:MAG TPA: type II secretion system protein GspH, partial [Thiotrichales bacterium]|nr:type II secretion system protein GspH [Thiotrichales bacterium]